jgi:hypothetical protein
MITCAVDERLRSIMEIMIRLVDRIDRYILINIIFSKPKVKRAPNTVHKPGSATP